MKYSLDTAIIILSLFLITEFLGLFVLNYYQSENLPYGMKASEVPKEESPIYFLTSIVIVTLFVLLLRKIKFELFLKGWFFLAILIGTAVTLNVFFGGTLAILLSLAITILRFTRDDLITHNLSEILLYGGIISLLLPSFDITSAIVFLIIISIYDYISVFLTKHMVELAKFQNRIGAFVGLKIINRDEFSILGGGDIALTLLFAGTALKENGILSAIFIIYGATLGLIFIMIKGKKKKFYPAMPFITAGSVIAYLISLL